MPLPNADFRYYIYRGMAEFYDIISVTRDDFPFYSDEQYNYLLDRLEELCNIMDMVRRLDYTMEALLQQSALITLARVLAHRL